MEVEKGTKFKIFIGCPKGKQVEDGSGLGPDTTDKALEEYFSKFGEVVEVIQLKWQKSGNKKGCGYINFSTMEAVEECVKTEKHSIGGREVVASKAKPKEALTKPKEDIRDQRDPVRKRAYDDGYGGDYTARRGAQKRGRRDVDDIDLEANIMRKLFVANFPLTTTEEELCAYFEEFGPIESCNIAKKKSGEARGYCFMVFEKAAGVDAVQLAKPHTMADKVLVTKRTALEEDKQNDNMSSKKIFIGSPNNFTFTPGTGGLNENISDDDLKDYFGQFGVVTQVLQLVHKDTGRKKGVGFVYFEDEDSVDKIVLIGAHVVKDRVLEAQKALSESKLTGNDDLEPRKQTDPKSKVMRKLFIRNLPKGTKLDDLTDYFGQFGELVDAEIPTIKFSGNKATYGFITYATMEQADECMTARPHEVNEKEVTVKRAINKEHPELASCLKVFLGSPGGRVTSVGGLNDTVSDEDLSEYFGQFGTLTSVKQIRDKNTDKHKGVGFIEYEDTDSVDKVVLLAIHEIKDRQIEATKALTDQQRRDQDMRKREERMLQMPHQMGTSGMSDYSTDFDGRRDRGRPESGFGSWRREREDMWSRRSRDEYEYGRERDRRDFDEREFRSSRRYRDEEERRPRRDYSPDMRYRRDMGGRRGYDDFDDDMGSHRYRPRESFSTREDEFYSRREPSRGMRMGGMDMEERDFMRDGRMNMREQDVMMGGGEMGRFGGMAPRESGSGGMGFMERSGGMNRAPSLIEMEFMQGSGSMGGSGMMGAMGRFGGGYMQGVGGMEGPGAMGGGRMGSMGGSSGMGSRGGNAASQGRKLLIDGLNGGLTDQMMSKYFQIFGELVDWGRDKAGGGYVVYTEPGMADYCLRKPIHQVNGIQILVEKAKSF